MPIDVPQRSGAGQQLFEHIHADDLEASRVLGSGQSSQVVTRQLGRGDEAVSDPQQLQQRLLWLHISSVALHRHNGGRREGASQFH